MVLLVALLDPLQYLLGLLDRRLGHLHRLEPAFQGRVPLHVLAIVVHGGGADALYLSPGKGGFQDVGGIHGALGRARANDGVHLVDEENAVRGALNLLDHLLESLFELSPVLGARHQRAHVQGDQPLALKGFGDVSRGDLLGQFLHDGSLAHTGLAHEHRVVLRAAAEDLNDPLHLGFPADDRVQLVGSGGLGQVYAQLVQRGRPGRIAAGAVARAGGGCFD